MDKETARSGPRFGIVEIRPEVYGVSSFKEEGLEHFWWVTPVEEVSIEGFCGGNVVTAVTVLDPESVKVSKDEALQDAFGVG